MPPIPTLLRHRSQRNRCGSCLTASYAGYDDEHSENKERWVTLGLAEDNTLLVVVHTLEELAENQAWVRIISARAATGPERKQYQSDR